MFPTRLKGLLRTIEFPKKLDICIKSSDDHWFSPELVKHDKLISKKAPAHHLRDVPEYLLDPTTRQSRRGKKQR